MPTIIKNTTNSLTSKLTTLRQFLKQEFELICNKLTELYPSINWRTKMFLAGGAIRDLANDQQPKDYDLYLKDIETVNAVVELFRDDPNVQKTYLKNYSLILSLDNDREIAIQIIAMLYGDPQTVVSKFDFTINHNFFSFDNEGTDPHFSLHTDALGKELIPGQDIFRPTVALARLNKFLSRGYYISPKHTLELAAKALRVAEIPRESRNELYNPVSGV